MSDTFFTSDFHLGHGNIIKYSNRPFLSERDRNEFNRLGNDWRNDKSRWRIDDESVSLMDDAIISNINKMVQENDTLWFLGDFCFAGRQNYYQTARKYRDRIRCKDVRLVFGNHDRRTIRDLFSETYDLTEIQINNVGIVLCHYALAVWNKSHRGYLCLYGHSHSGAENWLDEKMPGRRSMDVGIDNVNKLLHEFRPLAFNEIISIIGEKPGVAIDHHVRSSMQ